MRKLIMSKRVLPITLIILAVLSLGSTVFYISDQRAKTECQANFNKQFIQQLTERGAISDSDRSSLATLVKDVINAKTRDESRAALEAYLDTKEKNDAERRAHPLPTLSDDSAHC